MLLLFILGFLVGCGGSNSSSSEYEDTAREIDVADYLPSENMIKYFNYGVTFVYAAMGRREVEVSDNYIKITQYAAWISPGVTPEVKQDKSIEYTDTHITGFYEDTSGRFGEGNYMTDRYLKKNDRLVTEKREYSSDYYDVNAEMVMIAPQTLCKC